MTQEQGLTKADLLAQIEQNWAALHAALAALPLTALTAIRDAQGWSVKDHLIHMLYWERSALFLLQSQPRHLALGIDEALFLHGGEDAINAAIYQQNRDLPVEEAMAQWHTVHQQLLTALAPLTDADLQKRYRFYLPDEPGDGDGPPAYVVVINNSAHHYAEHLAWISNLVSQIQTASE